MGGIWIQIWVLDSLGTGVEVSLGLYWAVAMALAVGSAGVVFVLQLRGRVRDDLGPVLLGICAFVCCACLGAARVSGFWDRGGDDISGAVGGEAVLATIRGRIVSEPRVSDKGGWVFGRFKPGDPSSSFYLTVTEAEARDGWVAASGIVRVQVGEPVLDLEVGDHVQAYCWLERFERASNPGEFDVARYLARRGVFVAASVKSRDAITLVGRADRSLFVRVKTGLRKAASEALLGDLPGDESGRGLVQALLLGYRGDIDADTYQAFRKTGLLHFISLSGMHLGILIGIVWWVSKVVGLLRRGRAVVCIAAICVFLMAVPARAPTLRAAIICWVFCLSILFRRRSNSVNTLALAAIVLLLIRPTHLFEAGWQLSFSTVLGILLLEEPIEGWLRGTASSLRGRLRSGEEKPHRMLVKSGGWAVCLLATGLAAWLGGAGVLLYHFYRITPLACLWTVLVFPFVAMILTLGFFKIVVYFVLPTVSGGIGWVVSGLSEVMIWVVERLAWLDASDVLVGSVPLILIALYYVLAAAGFFWQPRRSILKRVTCVGGVVLLAGSLGVCRWVKTHPEGLVLTCLDVGHGQCIVAQLPGGGSIMFDAGSLHVSNPGGRIIVPFLQRAGIGRIDAIVISHNDVDHVNGVPEIVQAIEVGAVYANAAFFSEADEWGTARYLRDYLEGWGMEIRAIGESLEVSEDVSVEVIWPNKQDEGNAELSDNDRSVVCLIRFGGRKVLLCSDIEQYSQRAILRLYPDIRADVVTSPHHGSRRTSDPEFISRLGAEVVVHSCSRSEEEQAAVDSEAAEQAAGAGMFYTDRDGAVVVSISNEGDIDLITLR